MKKAKDLFIKQNLNLAVVMINYRCSSGFSGVNYGRDSVNGKVRVGLTTEASEFGNKKTFQHMFQGFFR